jgi:hypothetical protein
MRKFALAVLAASAAVFSFGVAAEAQYGAVNAVVTAVPPVVTPGGQFRTTFIGCTPGESVTFVFVSSNAKAACKGGASRGPAQGLTTPDQAGAGTAIAELTAPQAIGLQTGTATTSHSELSESFAITVVAAPVPQAELPATGSGGLSTTTGVAVGLFGIGIGLFGVSRYRRRQFAAA